MITAEHSNDAVVQTVTTPSGNIVEHAPWGGVRRLDIAGLSMIQHPASAFEAGLANVWLRVGDEAVPLLAPGVSWLQNSEDGPVVHAQALGLEVSLQWRLSHEADAWFVHANLHNPGAETVEARLVLTQDVALAPYAAVRINEYYVSQYLDLTAIEVPDHGTAIAVRQNMPSARVPWVVLGALQRADQWATDALQLVSDDDAPRLDLSLDLPSTRLQHEHTLAALATEPLTVGHGQHVASGFYGLVVPDHPAATSADDASHALAALDLGAAHAPDWPGAADGVPSVTSVFDCPVLVPDDLDDNDLTTLFGADRRLVEHAPADTDESGALWAFTAGDEVVTLAAKERAVLRPHGHVLRTGDSLAPETEVLTSTIWMRGVFASQITQGHVARGRLVSGRRTYLDLLRTHGVRIVVDRGHGPELLGLPSAWALRPDRARWVYAHDDLQVVVTVTAPTDRHVLEVALEVVRGRLLSATIAAHLALGDDDGQSPATVNHHRNGSSVRSCLAGRWLESRWRGAPVDIGGDELLVADGRSRGEPWLVGVFDEPALVTVEFSADVVPDDETVLSEHHLPEVWTTVRERLAATLPGGSSPGAAAEVEALDHTLLWFAHNAFVHHLSPRGLEQFSGGGWGTRDVSQGPVGLLTALAEPEALEATLLALFAAQNERGDWPQAFDFLPPGGYWSQFDSHGDVVFWPLLAMGEHLLSVGSAEVLSSEVPFVGDDGPGDAAPVLEHLRAAVDVIERSTVPGSPLPAYGHGDWNDSLQPADPALARQMASAWTATLQVHALSQLAAGLRAVHGDSDLADRCQHVADATREALRRDLMADGVLAGYGVFGDDGSIELLVHPRDTRTGLTWGVLPWIHAISGDQLSPDEARHHLDLIKQHLWGPDGARLFDRPAAYRGGPMQVFQRAEAATFWGREIGLMYMHAHLRYAEALARVGDVKGLFEAFMLVVPQGLSDRVAVARPRQTTCYYSSSDAVFADRVEAAARYDDLLAGDVDLEGGWRIYSSGPGLFLRLLVECLFGVRRRGERVEIDPVLDPQLDGLLARVPVPGGHVEIEYRVLGDGVGVTGVQVDGTEIETAPLTNPYRAPGVPIASTALQHGAKVRVSVGREAE